MLKALKLWGINFIVVRGILEVIITFSLDMQPLLQKCLNVSALYSILFFSMCCLRYNQI